MPRFRNILNLCLSASLSSKVIASHAITESAINTNSQASCYFISQKRALSEIFSYLKSYRIFKIPSSSTELCSLREKLSARKFNSKIACSFYLKISALGDRKLHSWDQQQHISLLVPGLPSNPALSTNFPVFPSSALHLCPLTHLSGSLLSSTPNFSLAGIIPGFKHPDLQSQACHCCQQGAAQWHPSMHPKVIQAQGISFTLHLLPSLGWQQAGTRSSAVSPQSSDTHGAAAWAQHPGMKVAMPWRAVLMHKRLLPKGGTRGTGCSPALPFTVDAVHLFLILFRI